MNVFDEESAILLEPFDEQERDELVRRWDLLLEKLLELTRNENKRIKQAAIIAVAAMADSLKGSFSKVTSTRQNVSSIANVLANSITSVSLPYALTFCEEKSL